ncbi:HAD-IA family hydrolase [Candidatus Saccharibacteria bacterium]|nr:MAG: HAD-IA family hydrolase [Candidatus Saccharibacteria bacterium]
MTRGIVFDCFGVLYGGSLNTITGMCPEDRLQDLRDLNKQADYGFIETHDYIAGIAELFDASYEDVETILRMKHQRNEELVEFVRLLKKDGEYKIGLLSNVSNGTVERLFGDELHELFDAVVLSYQEHLLKPNPAIFTLMAERLAVPTGECVMIDDIEENCDGAEVAGMQSIWHVTNDGTRQALARLLQNPQ